MEDNEMLKEYDFSNGIRGKYSNAHTDKTLTLTVSEWKAFVKHLKNPNQPSEALKNMMKRKF